MKLVGPIVNVVKENRIAPICQKQFSKQRRQLDTSRFITACSESEILSRFSGIFSVAGGSIAKWLGVKGRCQRDGGLTTLTSFVPSRAFAATPSNPVAITEFPLTLN